MSGGPTYRQGGPAPDPTDARPPQPHSDEWNRGFEAGWQSATETVRETATRRPHLPLAALATALEFTLAATKAAFKVKVTKVEVIP